MERGRWILAIEFDLIVSADTLVYFGALEDVAIAAFGALRHGEREAYVARVFADAGLAPDVTRAELRLESGIPVAGLVVMATKPSRRGF